MTSVVYRLGAPYGEVRKVAISVSRSLHAGYLSKTGLSFSVHFPVIQIATQTDSAKGHLRYCTNDGFTGDKAGRGRFTARLLVPPLPPATVYWLIPWHSTSWKSIFLLQAVDLCSQHCDFSPSNAFTLLE